MLLDKDLVDLVGKAYAADVAAFGYAFEDRRVSVKGGKASGKRPGGFKDLLGGFKKKGKKSADSAVGPLAKTGAEAPPPPDGKGR
jgi:hypothetical protein